MQLRIFDILSDPDNPDIWPLKLHVIKSEQRERKTEAKPYSSTGLLCQFYCFKKNQFLVNNPLQDSEETKSKDELDQISTLDECQKCAETEIIDGVIYHEQNPEKKWFMIFNEIAVMYPLELRDEKLEKQFIDRYTDELEKFGITEPFKG